MCKKLILGALLFSSMAISADEHGNRVGEISFDKSGSEYLVSGRDLVLLNQSGEQKALLNRNAYPVSAAEFSSDDSYVITVTGKTKHLKVLDKQGKEKATLRLGFVLPDNIEMQVVGYDSTIVLSSDKQLYFYEYKSGKIVKRAELPFPDSSFVNAYDISADGKYVFINDRRFLILKSPKSWIFKTAKSFVKVTGKIRKVRISDDGSQVMVLHQNGRGVSVHNAETGEMVKSYLLTSPINEVECDGKLSKAYFNGGVLDLVTGAAEVSKKMPNGRMNINAESNAVSVGAIIKKNGKLYDYTAPYQTFSSVQFDGETLVVNEADKTYEINAKDKTARKVAAKTFYKGRFKGLVGKSDDGRFGVDFSGRVYDYRQKAFVGRPLFGTGGYVLKASISTNGDIAFVGANKVYIYNHLNKKSITNFDLPVSLNQESEVSVSLSPSSKHCAVSYMTAGGLAEVYVYNLAESRPGALSRKITDAQSLLFTSDETLLIAGGKSILTTEYNGNKWMIKDAQSLLVESGTLNRVLMQGNYVAGLNENGRIHLFDYRTGREIYTVALKANETSMRSVGK